MNEMPMVSVIIPCRDEAKYIGKCLDSIIASDYPNENLEVLVIDGMSEDGTRKIVESYALKYSFIKLLENSEKITPVALNKGIRAANGQIIMRMDAHNIYERDYISKCVKYLKDYNVDNVGGICITLPGTDRLLSKSIALALSHPFGVGNAYFRIAIKVPKYVDTVPFGCYERGVFNRIGLFDEDLIRNQDDEFNMRLIKNGGKILLVPDIVSYYYARDSLSKLWKMYFQYGYFKPLVAKKIRAILTWRQLIPVFFVSFLIISGILSLIFKPFSLVFFFMIISYLIANIGFTLLIAVGKGFKYLFTLPFIFATLHFSYGLGYLKGIWDFIFFKKHEREKIQDIHLTR
jgi:cellulose synthase/poly-beta-1,6-N-acetylglucosamine synthase-like glycosyltransferase